MVAELEPRDAGFAIAALAIEGDGAPDLGARAPRGAGPRIEAALKALLSGGGVAPAKQKLGPQVDDLRRTGPGAALAMVHASWIADALADEPDDVIEAVLHVLPDGASAQVRAGLGRLSRAVKAGPKTTGLKAELEPLVAEKWRARAFKGAGRGAADDALKASKELRWLFTAPKEEIELCGREIGIRAVSRAFSGISKEDLSKLCQGLPPSDSVRLVSAVVELREAMKPEELRPLQRVHLKLLKSGGVSPELFADAGLAMLAEALLSKLNDRGRHAIAWRLPEPLGRRLLDLSAPGAAQDEASRQKYLEELPVWMGELEKKGMAVSYAKSA